MWTIEYDNDTGYDDDSFTERWTVTDGTRRFDCSSKEDAEWLFNVLQWQPVKS